MCSANFESVVLGDDRRLLCVGDVFGDKIGVAGIEGHMFWADGESDGFSNGFVKRNLDHGFEDICGAHGQPGSVGRVAPHILELVHGQHEVWVVDKSLG